MALTKIKQSNLTNPYLDDIALLGFKVAAAGNLARYNLVDQSVDAFEDATGVNASSSVDATRNAAGKYYSGVGAPADTYAAFTTVGNDTWTAPSDVTTAEVLVVAGGGRGGANHGGGGGGGGIIYHATYPIVGDIEYDITVGGGADISSYSPSTGGDSVFNVNNEGSQTLMTATGGGSGAGATTTQGSAGGSGGGPGGHSSPGSFPYAGNQGTAGAPAGAVAYGNDGGAQAHNHLGGGGGGGGANAAGGASTSNGSNGGVGGAGQVFVNFTSYGVSGYFGGGGGGGMSTTGSAGGAGGSGGGGAGGSGTGGAGADGAANTGGGGGGGSQNGGAGGVGGSGTVIIKYLAAPEGGDMTLISTAQTANDGAPTKANLVMTYTNGAGSNVINTDIIASVSRDGGTTFTTATLSSQGTTGGHTILTANNIDISGQPSGTSMVWKVATNNQSVSKVARIHAVSLGWS